MRLFLIALLLPLVSCTSLFQSDSESSRTDQTVTIEREAASLDPDKNRAQRVEEDALEGVKLKGEDAAQKALRKRILVLPFQNRTVYGGPELGDYAASEVKTRLGSNPELIIISQEEVSAYESLIPVRGNLNMKQIFEAARSYAVVAVVTGTIDDVQVQERGNQVGILRTRYNTVTTSLRLQLWDVSTGKSLFTKIGSAEVTEEHTKFFGDREPAAYESTRAENAVALALEKVLPGMAHETRKISWMGRIAKIDLHRYYVNAGEQSGLTKGQLLRVFGDAFPVVDHESSMVIGMAPGRFKGILRVVDFFGSDGAIAVLHSGAGFRERDRVEVFAPPQP